MRIRTTKALWKTFDREYSAFALEYNTMGKQPGLLGIETSIPNLIHETFIIADSTPQTYRDSLDAGSSII